MALNHYYILFFPLNFSFPDILIPSFGVAFSMHSTKICVPYTSLRKLFLTIGLERNIDL